MTNSSARKRARTLSLAALSGAVAVAVAAGCAGSPDPEAADSATPAAAPTAFTAPRTVPAGMGSDAADGAFPRTVGHFAGSTTVPRQPTRVVVLSTGQLDGLLTLGVVPVAATRGDDAALVPAYLTTAFPQYAAQLAQISDVGGRGEPNLEAVAQVKPDLILMNSSVLKGDVYKAASAIAPTVVTEGTGVNWKQDFLLIAAAAGRSTQAQGILDTFHTDAAGVGRSLGKPATVSFLRVNGDRTRIFGVASFTGSIAEDAGLARPKSQQFDKTSQDISNEQLDLADADWLFYGVQGGAAKADALTRAPIWPTLEAVVAKRAVAVDDDPWYLNAGPTAARVVLDQLRASLVS
ncbi:iron-siderophore ABC transporter substrate-binding protein [Micromonospora sp. NPDC049523]|uniref:iron-siderophore ABC transporter substrate-binding protein n=1 Tax=Micromonospora sp. NPDC049523 TaxID=3155921 RepID=UPI003442046C